MTRFGFLLAFVSLLTAGCVGGLSTGEAAATKGSSDAVEIRVGTVNVRYPNPADDKAGNGWKARKDDLMALIRKLDMDVFGLQEVHEKPYVDMCVGLPEWDIIDEYMVTAPIAYRRSRFDLENHGVFWLSETPDVPQSLGWGAANIRPCCWMILKEKKGGRRFCFVNTHTDHRSEQARLEGVKLILRRMKTFAGGLPVVFVGDHNCGPATAPAVEVRKTMKDARDIAEIRDPGPVNTFHNWGVIKDVDWRRCDYIYVSDGIRVKDFVTHADKRPNSDRYPTDLYPCTATIEF